MTVMNHSGSVLLVEENDFEVISSRAEGQSSWLAENHKDLKPPSSSSSPSCPSCSEMSRWTLAATKTDL